MAAVYTFYRTKVKVLLYGVPIVGFQAMGQIQLAHHGRQYMAVFQMEVVVGTVQIGGHDGYVIGAVLQVEAFTHFQSGYLGDGVRLVGIFQRGSKQGVLCHGLRSHARIDACAAQE